MQRAVPSGYGAHPGQWWTWRAGGAVGLGRIGREVGSGEMGDEMGDQTGCAASRGASRQNASVSRMIAAMGT